MWVGAANHIRLGGNSKDYSPSDSLFPGVRQPLCISRLSAIFLNCSSFVFPLPPLFPFLPFPTSYNVLDTVLGAD